MKRFTVKVEGHCLEEVTYRILAKTEKEAAEKAEERFREEVPHDFDVVIAEIKTKKRGQKIMEISSIKLIVDVSLSSWGKSRCIYRS